MLITQKAIAEYVEAKKVDFVKLVTQSMNSFLGKSSTSVVIYHLGGDEALRDPDSFAKGLKAIFREEGAEVILKCILRDLEASQVKP